MIERQLPPRAGTPNEHSPAETPDVTLQILAYLLDNPAAQDTLEGIVQWWLLASNIKHNIGKVKESLNRLIDQGFVIELGGKDQRTHYRLNRAKLAEIKALLSRR